MKVARRSNDCRASVTLTASVWLFLGLAVLGCNSVVNNLPSPQSPSVQPATTRSGGGGAPEVASLVSADAAPRGGPRVIRVRGSFFVTGLGAVPVKGNSFNVLDKSGSLPIGRVHVIGDNGSGCYPVDWDCWPERSDFDQNPVPEAWNIVSTRADEGIPGNKCWGRFERTATFSPNPGKVATERDSSAVNLDLDSNVHLEGQEQFELFSLGEQGRDPSRLGSCRVVPESIRRGRASCKIEDRDDSAPLLESSVRRGVARLARPDPTEDQLTRFIRNHADAECSAAPQAAAPLSSAPATPVPTVAGIPFSPNPDAAPAPEGSSNDESRARNSASPWAVARPVALSVGAAALIAGSIVVGTAWYDYRQARKRCPTSSCSDEPYEEIQDARTRGWWATGLFAVGGAGVGIYFLSRPREPQVHSSSTGPRIDHLELQGSGARLQGSF